MVAGEEHPSTSAVDECEREISPDAAETLGTPAFVGGEDEDTVRRGYVFAKPEEWRELVAVVDAEIRDEDEGPVAGLRGLDLGHILEGGVPEQRAHGYATSPAVAVPAAPAVRAKRRERPDHTR